jgi:hypothetical protein
MLLDRETQQGPLETAHSLMVTRTSRRRTLSAFASKLGSRMSGATTTTSVSAGAMAADHAACATVSTQAALQGS